MLLVHSQQERAELLAADSRAGISQKPVGHLFGRFVGCWEAKLAKNVLNKHYMIKKTHANAIKHRNQIKQNLVRTRLASYNPATFISYKYHIYKLHSEFLILTKFVCNIV